MYVYITLLMATINAASGCASSVGSGEGRAGGLQQQLELALRSGLHICINFSFRYETTTTTTTEAAAAAADVA